ncbi:MAG TPA: hypothetical protein VFZ70_12030 [Euzebyales bacterium]
MMMSTTSTDGQGRERAPQSIHPVSLAAVGGVCGLAWATGLRGFMAEIAGTASGVEWVGTFVWILAPGVLAGALLGWAEHLRRTGGRRGWRWLATAPLLFAGVLVHGLVTAPGGPMAGLEEFLADGLGGGAIGMPLFGMAGGYALSGRGRLWGRIVCGLIALTPIPIWILTVTGFGGPELAVTTSRGAWVALYFWSFLAVLALGCAIPHRSVVGPPTGGQSSVTTARRRNVPTHTPVP